MYFGTQVELINVYVKGTRNVDRNIRLNKCQIRSDVRCILLLEMNGS